MDCLAVLEQHNPQIPAVDFRDLSPASNSTVGLHRFPNRFADRAFDPVVSDRRPVWTGADCIEILRDLHDRSLTGLLAATQLSYCQPQ